jgi:hypothetical protein
LRTILSCLALCALIVPASSGQTPVDDAALARAISAYVEPFRARDLSGTLLVARGGRIIFHESYGLADYEHRVRFMKETPAVVASLNKPFTVIIAAALIEQGRLSLNDTVSKHLPEYRHGSRMTVGQLMSHTAGVPHRLLPEDRQTEPRTAQQMVQVANDLDLLFEPGARSSYSSGGYTILAAVLERASGLAYKELLRRYVAEPVNARTLRDAGARDIVPGRARSVMLGGDVALNTPLRDLSFLVGAGSVTASAADVYAVIKGLIGGIYPRTARARLVSANGLAWNGVTNGYRAFADYRTRDSLYVIFVGNAHTGVIDLLRREIPRVAGGETASSYVMPKHTPVALNETARTRLTGTYDTGGGSLARLVFVTPSVALFGDRIMTAVNDSTLFSYADYALVAFESDNNGKVNAIQWGAGTWGTGQAGPRFMRVD